MRAQSGARGRALMLVRSLRKRSVGTSVECFCVVEDRCAYTSAVGGTERSQHSGQWDAHGPRVQGQMRLPRLCVSSGLRRSRACGEAQGAPRRQAWLAVRARRHAQRRVLQSHPIAGLCAEEAPTAQQGTSRRSPGRAAGSQQNSKPSLCVARSVVRGRSPAPSCLCEGGTCHKRAQGLPFDCSGPPVPDPASRIPWVGILGGGGGGLELAQSGCHGGAEQQVTEHKRRRRLRSPPPPPSIAAEMFANGL